MAHKYTNTPATAGSASLIPGRRSGKARGKHLGPRTPETRRSARCSPNSGRFAQTPCESSEGRANAPQTPKPLRSVSGSGRTSPGAGEPLARSAGLRSAPDAAPALRSGRAQPAPREAGKGRGLPGPCRPSCSRPPQLRSQSRGSGLPPGPGQPIKQNTNVTIFFLLIASPDISERWEGGKR